jgi:hypothetical protein
MTGLDCRLDQVEPRATTEIFLPEQAAIHGGSLDVKPTRSSTDTDAPAWSHLKPQFTGRVTLATSQSQQLHAGQRGKILLDTHRGSFGDVLISRTRAWIRRRTEAVR